MSDMAVKPEVVKMTPQIGKQNLWQKICYYKSFYILFLPAFIIYALFSYFPMYGIILAFKKELSFAQGIWGSEWAAMHGLKHFYDLFTDLYFQKSFFNTLIISLQRLVFEFPVPIILSLLINEIRQEKFKKIAQTVFTFPHFLSWVVVSGIFLNLLSDSGVVNSIIVAFGGEKVNLLTQASTFRGFLYATSDWKEMGWGTIIYLAAIAGINGELYEAAIVDGAKRFQLVRYITWPCIRSVIGVMLVLSISNMMNAGFDQIFNMYNAAVYSKADIIDTYVYRRTFVDASGFASSTAIGLFKSVINFILLFLGNTLVKRFVGKSIY